MRTPLTYFGGKQRLAPELVGLMEPHRIYLEPFAGGAAVLFAKPRAERETLNDLDYAVVSFWRCLRDRSDELAAAIERTPYSRTEWKRCTEGLDATELDELERARRFLVSIDQSYARSGDTWSPPSILSDRRGRWQAGTWENVPAKIIAASDRLRGVALECADAVSLLDRFDADEALIYCDPPYTGANRIDPKERRGGNRGGRGYRCDDYPELWPGLVDRLLEMGAAQIILSGYPCPDTDRLEGAGWHRVDLTQRRLAQVKTGQGGTPAPETAWLNRIPQGRLFAPTSAQIPAAA